MAETYDVHSKVIATKPLLAAAHRMLGVIPAIDLYF